MIGGQFLCRRVASPPPAVLPEWSVLKAEGLDKQTATCAEACLGQPADHRLVKCFPTDFVRERSVHRRLSLLPEFPGPFPDGESMAKHPGAAAGPPCLILRMSGLFVTLLEPHPQPLEHACLEPTRGSCWLRSLIAHFRRFAVDIALRFGADISRLEAIPHDGQLASALRSAIDRNSANTPHTRHS